MQKVKSNLYCGRVVSGGIGCPSSQQKVKTEPESVMQVEKDDQKIN